MPRRDRTDTGQAGGSLAITRRATLAGLGTILIIPHLDAAAMTGGAPLRIGVMDLGFDAAVLGRVTLARWGRPAVPVMFESWGSLADHAATGHDGIDAAVLPAEGAEPLLVPPGLQANLLLRTTRPRRIGVALRHPRSEAALRSLLPDVPILTLLAMPPAMLVGNLKAGVIDAALLLGVDALAADDIPAGVTAIPLGQDLATTLLPPLTVRLRTGAWDREASSA